MRIHLNIGSNQGDRAALIGRAVALLVRALPDACVRCSAPVESEPWGFDSPSAFLNVGVMLDLPRYLAPEALLDITQAAERAISPASHRNPDGSYRDRLIDIDIIAVDRLRIDTPRLTLPHPRAHLRAFVLDPLRELDPQLHAELAALRP